MKPKIADSITNPNPSISQFGANMSSNNRREIPQQLLGIKLRSFFKQTMSDDEDDKDIQAALCMIARTSPDDPRATNVHTFGAGDASTLAQLLIAAIEASIEKVPGFNEAWTRALRIKQLESVLGNVLEATMEAIEAKGMEAVKPEADAIIQKLKGNPGVVPGSETKQ
jgi:hypothetical protein